MNLLYILLIVLVSTRLCGEAAERLKQPALVGELIAGIALGAILHSYSTSLPVLAHLPVNEVFKGLTDLAIFFLMLLAGIELRPQDLVKASGPAFAVALGGDSYPSVAWFWTRLVFCRLRPLKLPNPFFSVLLLQSCSTGIGKNPDRS